LPNAYHFSSHCNVWTKPWENAKEIKQFDGPKDGVNGQDYAPNGFAENKFF
jgi:hypothetical protein